MKCSLSISPMCLKFRTNDNFNQWNKDSCWTCIMLQVKKYMEYQRLKNIRDEQEKIDESRMANILKCREYYKVNREKILEYWKEKTRERQRVKKYNMQNINYVKRYLYEKIKQHNERMDKIWKKEEEELKTFNFFDT